MRYADLKQILLRMTEKELDQSVIVFDEILNECHSVLMLSKMTSDHDISGSESIIKKDDLVFILK